jgi:hypothetical protein
MEIRVNIPDELAARAESRGVPVERYVEGLLSQHLPARTEYNPPRTPEKIRSMARFVRPVFGQGSGTA